MLLNGAHPVDDSNGLHCKSEGKIIQQKYTL